MALRYWEIKRGQRPSHLPLRHCYFYIILTIAKLLVCQPCISLFSHLPQTMEAVSLELQQLEFSLNYLEDSLTPQFGSQRLYSNRKYVSKETALSPFSGNLTDKLALLVTTSTTFFHITIFIKDLIEFFLSTIPIFFWLNFFSFSINASSSHKISLFVIFSSLELFRRRFFLFWPSQAVCARDTEKCC